MDGNEKEGSERGDEEPGGGKKPGVTSRGSLKGTMGQAGGLEVA